MILNKYQTPIDSDLVGTLSNEERAELIEMITSSQFIQSMISPHRKRAKDLEREDGRVKVDLVNLHILEDMDYFRQVAIHFQEHGTYTFLHPNKHPFSEYSQFWKKEIDRCLNGMTRESDGEWIPGDLYWYWNYSPIPLSKKRSKTSKRADRVMDLPRVYDGDYMFYHYCEQAREEGHHGVVLKSRGKGFSLKDGSQLAKRLILGDSGDARKSVKSYAVANEREYLTKDGVLNKFMDVVDFCANHTPFPRLKLKQSWNEMYWQMGYVDTETDTRKGSLNEVFGVTLKNDPNRARGKRGAFIYWEEMGKFPDFLTAWQIARPSVEEDGVAYGFMLAAGTGGANDADFYGANEMFYNPRGYNVHPMPNVFDKNAKPGAECAFFFPDYLNKLGFYDDNGNSDIVGGLVQLVHARHIIKYNTADPNAIVQEKAEHPVYPQEAVMRKEGNRFPVVDLKERLAEIKPDLENFVAQHYIGKFYYKEDGKIQWKQDHDLVPLRSFQLSRGTDTSGCMEIYSMPKKNAQGVIPRYRYIMGVDPVDSDAGTSLGSAFVFDTFTATIVAEYTGRPRFTNDFYEGCLRLSEYYNAIINYENNIKGFYTYFYQKNKLHMLCDNPQILKDNGMLKGSYYGNQAHPYSQHVYTPSGKKLWGDIKVGDELFGENGNITKVIDIPFDGVTDIYKITLWDGRVVEASSNHLWKIISQGELRDKPVPTHYLTENFKSIKGNTEYYRYNYALPNNGLVEYPYASIPIDPYTLGIILGDGTTTRGKYNTNSVLFASNLEDVKTYKKECPYKFSEPYDDRHMRIYIKNASNIFKELGLHGTTSHSKFIPDLFKYNSSEVRRGILAGVLDTDGHVNGDGNIMYTSVSKQLIDDVAWISRSLGFTTKISKKRENKYNGYYSLTIITSEHLFKLDRKNKKITQPKSGKKYNRTKGVTILNIEYSHGEKSKCVTVDNESHCYLIGDFIVTHNSKGTRATKDVNAYGIRMQRDWMISPSYSSTEEQPLMNLQEIRSIAYMEEAVAWNPDGNFDRVSAMGMVMILWEEIRKYSDGAQNEAPKSSFATGDFFLNNYPEALLKAKLDFFKDSKNKEVAIIPPNKFSDFNNNL